MARIVVKCWTDPDFASGLKKSPKRIMEEEGFEFEEGGKMDVEFHFDGQEMKHLVIPRRPDLMKLDRDQLHLIAAQAISIQLELF